MTNKGFALGAQNDPYLQLQLIHTHPSTLFNKSLTALQQSSWFHEEDWHKNQYHFQHRLNLKFSPHEPMHFE
jgi:hypothetical protein